MWFCCGPQLWHKKVLPANLPVPSQPLAFGELAEHFPILLTHRNSNCALTQELPRPGKILQDILEITCSSKHF